MKKRKIDGFTCFIFLLLSLASFFLIQLLYGIKEEQKQYTTMISLGNLQYDSDFLNKASKITGIQEIWPVVEIPVTIKIGDYTKTCTFSGIDFDAFTTDSGQDTYGNTPVLILGGKALANMKDSNGHTLSQKQQEKYLKADTDLSIMYSLETADNPEAFTETPTTSQKTAFLPCKVAAILTEEDQIYLPLSQAQALFSKTGTQRNVTKILLKIKGKENLEKARELFENPSVD